MEKYRFLDSSECRALGKWHQRLDDHRGDRARLRRAEKPEDVLLTDAFFHFQQQMPESWQNHTNNSLFACAAVAGLLAHVEKDKKTESKIHKSKAKVMASFAEQLATPIKGDKAPMSEMRFQQLQKSRTTNDFYLGIIRAIRILSKQVNILSLANDIIHWHKEYANQIDRNPANRLAVRWATDYFTASPKDSK